MHHNIVLDIANEPAYNIQLNQCFPGRGTCTPWGSCKGYVEGLWKSLTKLKNKQTNTKQINIQTGKEADYSKQLTEDQLFTQ